MTTKRLTNRILNAIVEMACQIETEGANQMQGYTSEKKQEEAYYACLDAGDWAAQQLRKRIAKKSALSQQNSS